MLMNSRWVGKGVYDLLFSWLIVLDILVPVDESILKDTETAGFFSILQKPRKISEHIRKF